MTERESFALANALRDARRRRGLNQEKAAAELGVTRTTLARWETGDTPSATDTKTIRRIADFIGTSAREVLALAFLPQEEPTTPAEREKAERDFRELEQAVEELRRRFAEQSQKNAELSDFVMQFVERFSAQLNDDELQETLQRILQGSRGPREGDRAQR